MKKLLRLLSIVLTCALVLCSTTSVTAFAEDHTEPSSTENSSTSGIMPLSQGDIVNIAIGQIGYMSNCGYMPKFRFKGYGGSANTTIRFYVTSPGGTTYTVGDIASNASQYIDRQFFVLVGNGDWEFTAVIVSGSDPTHNILGMIQQIY